MIVGGDCPEDNRECSQNCFVPYYLAQLCRLCSVINMACSFRFRFLCCFVCVRVSFERMNDNVYILCVLKTTLCSKKVPTFKLSVSLSNLSGFSKRLHCGKAYKIFYKNHTHCKLHLKYVATLPWEIKNSNFLQILKKIQTNCIFKKLPTFEIRLSTPLLCTPSNTNVLSKSCPLAEYHVDC